jgi:hypothetical protein
MLKEDFRRGHQGAGRRQRGQGTFKPAGLNIPDESVDAGGRACEGIFVLAPHGSPYP